MGSGWEVPSLLRLCIQTAIDNVRYIGDVGETDITLLKDILPHCTLDQLAHIEKSTEGRDLSAVTDSLWKRFYEGAFGVESVNLVVKRMKENAVVFKWRLLYEAKAKEREAAQKKIAGQLKQRYAEEEKSLHFFSQHHCRCCGRTLCHEHSANQMGESIYPWHRNEKVLSGYERQSRQIQVVDKKPPSTCKRMFSGGNESCYNVSNIKGSLMKKAKLEYLNSHEAKIHATMRKNALKSKNFPPPSAVRPTNTSSILGKGSASSSKPTKPLTRRL